MSINQGSGMITCSYHYLFYDLLNISCCFVVNDEVEER